MKSPPVIVVQLVHIEGPLKGQIQEFTDPVVSIGRHPSGHVCFPKNETAVSRNHAEIVREGNRFRVIDKSTNGTFVNGKRIQDAHLKDGDVLAFSEGGPKASFLTNVLDGPSLETAPPKQTAPPQAAVPPPQGAAPGQIPTGPPPAASPASVVQPAAPVFSPPKEEPTPSPSISTPPPQVEDVEIQRIQVPLIIQYGPTLQSFKEVPVSIGKNPACEFALEHPAMQDHHAQIFFHQDQYWVKDLTGQHVLSINGRPVQAQAPLNPDDQLALSPQGPTFRFLGGGRLAEIEIPQAEQGPEALPRQEADSLQDKSESKGLKGAKAIFDKFLRR